MTPKQFQRAAAKTRLKSRTREAAKLVLVDLLQQSEVARQLNLSRQAVSIAVQRICNAHANLTATDYHITDDGERIFIPRPKIRGSKIDS